VSRVQCVLLIQVQAIERAGGSPQFSDDLDIVKESHADLLSSVGKSQSNLHESLGQWRSYEMSLKEVCLSSE